MMAMKTPKSESSELEEKIEFAFLIIFTIEMSLKILAMGFVAGKHTYLRDSWNILDFTVVVMGWASNLLGGNDISAIRTLRVLRPLRTINYLKGMRILVRSIMNSIPKLVDVLIF